MVQGQQGITVQDIAEGVRVCLGPGGLSNSLVVEGHDTVLVVDTQLTPSLGRRVKDVASESGKPIKYVLLTHGDSDHVFGTQEFWPVSVVLSHRLTRDRIGKEGNTPIERAIQQRPHLKAEMEAVRIVVPEVGFEGDLEIDLGGLIVKCLYMGPAHTPGDVAVWIAEKRVLHTADLVFNGIFPVMRMADVNGWLRSLDKLERLDPAVVVPGHGSVGDSSVLEDQRRLLIAVRDRVKAAKSSGLSVDQAVSQIRFPEYEQLPMAAARIPEAIKHLYSAI